MMQPPTLGATHLQLAGRSVIKDIDADDWVARRGGGAHGGIVVKSQVFAEPEENGIGHSDFLTVFYR